jgi:hypothetical protein
MTEIIETLQRFRDHARRRAQQNERLREYHRGKANAYQSAIDVISVELQIARESGALAEYEHTA